MPDKLVSELMQEVKKLREALTQHLIESGGIKTQLKINTWLTGLILTALLGKFIAEYFKR